MRRGFFLPGRRYLKAKTCGKISPVVNMLICMGILLTSMPVSAQTGGIAAVRRQIEAIEGRSRELEDRTAFLLDQYGRDIDITIREFERRFSEAEVHFLLGNYSGAIVLLYDIVDAGRFQHVERYDDALYYLAESLFRQSSWLPARGFFLELIQRSPTEHDDDALIRLMEIGGRTKDYSGIEVHYRRLLDSGRTIRPEVRYVWGKFIFAREDLENRERWARARQAFGEVPIDGPYGLAAKYFTGVVYVQEARILRDEARIRFRANREALEEAQKRYLSGLERAASVFHEVVAEPVPERRGQSIQEYTWLALGRVYLEMNMPQEAIDSYQRISRHSTHYFTSLYEIVWAFVALDDLDNARRAAEILLTGAGDSTLAPEIRLLLGHLHARNKRYERAVEAYEEVIVEYSPVRDELDNLLVSRDDPVSFFIEAIEDAGGRFDVDAMLPADAARWASTSEDVERGFYIGSAISDSRQGLDEGRDIAARILSALDAGTLEPFPTLSEGHRRAMEALSDVFALQSEIAEIESELIAQQVPPSLQAEYERVRLDREMAEDRFHGLPATSEQIEERRSRLLGRVDSLHRETFRARVDAEAQISQIEAMQRHLRESGDEMIAGPGEMEAFMDRLSQELAEIRALENEASGLMRELDRLADGIRSETVIAGASDTVAEYERAIEAEKAVYARIRAVTGAHDAKMQRIDRIRNGMVRSTDNLNGLIEDIGRRGAVRREVMREQVMNELRRLDEYAVEVSDVDLDTRELVGQLAYNSVMAVREQFHRLVLRSDVGIIDAAWAKKSDSTTEIQRLVEEQDRQLRILESDFRDVLRDAGTGLSR